VRALLVLTLLVAAGFVLLGSRLGTLLEGKSPGRLRGLTLFELLALHGQERARSERLNRSKQYWQRCFSGKDQVARDLYAGRTDLLGAAAAFRRLQADVPGYDWETFLWHFPADSEEESLCLAVIDYVERASGDETAERAALAARLREELRSRKERGPLLLPGPRPVREPPSLGTQGE
jgi:hypothetical protein